MLLSLSNVPRDYAWGSVSLLALLEGREPGSAPEAEVWFGDHRLDPADLAEGGTLDAVTGGALPYLLKLLAAGSPLSIQVHPTIEQARAGWRREAQAGVGDEHRSYRDANHKPELLVALSERFEVFSGLRPVADTLRLLALLGDSDGVVALAGRLRGNGDPLRDAIAWLLTEATSGDVNDVIAAIRVLETAASGEDRAVDAWRPTLRAVLAVADRYPGDPGVVVALLMNFLVLGRGDALFVRPGMLHAYVAGLGVEIMATSDNVVRGGLTSKRVDVPELLAILDTEDCAASTLHPVRRGAVADYPVPVSDFALRRVELSGKPVQLSVSGPTTVLVTAGTVAVEGSDRRARSVPVGRAIFATEDERELTLAGSGEVFVAEPGGSAVARDTP